MSNTFQPVLENKPAKSTPEKFRLKVLPQAHAAPAFSLVTPKPAVILERPPSPAPVCEPAITLERDGNRVKLINVKCGCGQTLQLECDYAAVDK